MPVTAPEQRVFQYPWNPVNAALIKAFAEALETAANAGTLTANALSADTPGRAVMATGYFSEAKATDAFAAGAIVGSLLKDGALSADVTGRAKVATSFFDETTATGKFAAGAITTALLKAGVLSADETGRALFATGVLDESTVNIAVAAQAIDSDRLKNGSITATQLASDLTLAKRTVTVDEDALSGASQVVDIGAVLPANAVVLGHEVVVNEQGVLDGNDLTITVGGTDAAAIVASTELDVLTAGKYQCTLGTHPRGSFSSEQLVATFAASDLATLSAGNWTITVWYSVLA